MVNRKFVFVAVLRTSNNACPVTIPFAGEEIAVGIPIVEGTHDRDLLSIWGPDAEAAFVSVQVGSHSGSDDWTVEGLIDDG